MPKDETDKNANRPLSFYFTALGRLAVKWLADTEDRSMSWEADKAVKERAERKGMPQPKEPKS